MSDDMSLPALFEATRLDAQPKDSPIHLTIARIQHFKHPAPQTVSSLTLPVELRLQIYKYAIPAMPYDLP
ncbi:hypothetical protein SNOG_02997 [Parastagonospora nodorum SN15]|uniref:Uncharacterized protein n=1 Tax=Phaeosphaeria nodorum (strain SN15 / ATCC MYA-4574 / FGSC 10173) TaxID=321614 RepID=Q0UZ17_PHANO|nr:hypothetical protein SNOG_02997 [Parastagonospora nodorum SN15]EAT89728.1 hypothetical protein SNOG_02997 [Parastagonospora nodorum SN15]